MATFFSFPQQMDIFCTRSLGVFIFLGAVIFDIGCERCSGSENPSSKGSPGMFPFVVFVEVEKKIFFPPCESIYKFSFTQKGLSLYLQCRQVDQ